MKFLTRITFFILFSVFVNLSFSQRDLPSGGVSCATKITNITVIPTHVDQVYENQDVEIGCDGEITKISPHSEPTEEDSIHFAQFVDDGFAVQVDGTGKFLIAAFSDAHVHLPKEEELESFFQLNLMNGVTSMRSMRGEDWHLNIDKNEFYTPKLYLSAPPLVDSSFANIDSLQMNVKQYAREGWDFIKLLSIDTSANYLKLQRIARAANIKVAGHAPHGVSIKALCDQGNFMSIEHLGGISDLSDLEQIVYAIKHTNKANIYHCPTINWAHSFQFTKENLLAQEGLKYVSQSMKDGWDKELTESSKGRTDEELAQFRMIVKKHSSMMISYLQFLYQQGGNLLLSPDASGAYNIPGYSYHDEIQHFKAVGMSNREILHIASSSMAEMFGEKEEWGMLKTGAKTDLLILNSNPLEDISNAQDIEAVIMRGRLFFVSDIQNKLLHP